MKKAEKTTNEVTTKIQPPPKTTKTIRSERDKITRAQAIKLFCIECMGYQKFLVKDCSDPACPLWPYRRGHGQEHTEFEIRK